LYHKSSIEGWDLPEGIIDQLNLENNDYYFVISSKEQEKQGQNHIHLSIYPTKFDTIHLLQVETPRIIPKLLIDTLKIIRDKGFEIVTSTGFCKTVNKCYYGIFFGSGKVNKEELLQKFSNLENVKKALLFKFTCEGCKRS
ncbi:MAG: hypothetical protein P8Y97_18130, partial [Candidatus Lokiarchaeota archaeon]